MQNISSPLLQEQNTFLNLDFESDLALQHQQSLPNRLLTKNFSELSFPGSSLTSTSTLANFHENSDVSLPPSSESAPEMQAQVSEGDDLLHMLHSLKGSDNAGREDFTGSNETTLAISAPPALSNKESLTGVPSSTASIDSIASAKQKFLSASSSVSHPHPGTGRYSTRDHMFSPTSDTTLSPWDASLNSAKSFSFLQHGRVGANAGSSEFRASLPLMNSTLQEIQEQEAAAVAALDIMEQPTFSNSFIEELIENAHHDVIQAMPPPPRTAQINPYDFHQGQLHHLSMSSMPHSQESFDDVISSGLQLSQTDLGRFSESSLGSAHLDFQALNMGGSQAFLGGMFGQGLDGFQQQPGFLNQQSFYFNAGMPTPSQSQDLPFQQPGNLQPELKIQTKVPAKRRTKTTKPKSASLASASSVSSQQALSEPGTSISPPSASTSAGKQTTTRRKIVEQHLECQQCTRVVGCVYIRGSKTPVEPHDVLRFVCGMCDGHVLSMSIDSLSGSGLSIQRDDSLLASSEAFENGESSSSQRGGSNSRKRKSVRAALGTIECEVCRVHLGTGGLMSESERALKDFEREVHQPHDMDEKEKSKSSNQDLKAEYTCPSCTEKYMFCSECGGGGKQRTGKWRPKELFDPGRRTCSLPHIRVGNADIRYLAIDLNQNIPTSSLIGIQDVFFDCYLSLFGIPAVMNEPRHGGSYISVRNDIENVWRQSVLDIITSPCPPHLKRFVTVGWIDKRHRNKGKGRFAPRDTVPWLERLDLDGVFKSTTPLPTDSEEWNRCYVSFCVTEYDPISDTAFLLQMAPRSVFLKTMDGYQELLRMTMEQIKTSCGRYPQHVLCWAKAEHSRLVAVPTRLKFVPLNEYLDSNPSLPSHIFSKTTFPLLTEPDTLFFATHVSNLLKSSISRN